MFYNALKEECPLQIDPFKALIGPRPIGWISSISKNGIANLAPYSFFNAVSANPPVIMFSSSGRKDSINNIETTGEFVYNLATAKLSAAVNESSISVAPDVDEFELIGLEKMACQLINVPRVASSPVALECKYLKTIELEDLDNKKTGDLIVFGQVIGVHIDDNFIKEGRVRSDLLQPLARHGYMDFSIVSETFRIERPN